MMVMIMVTMMTTMTMREMFNQETNTITDTHVGNYEKIVSTSVTEQICLPFLQFSVFYGLKLSFHSSWLL